MRIAIIGGTGFVGSRLADRLSAAGHGCRLLVRPGSESKQTCADCEVVAGSLGDSAALVELVRGCELVIYSVGLLREFPSRGITFQETQSDGVGRVMDAARDAGVGRFFLLSANGIDQARTAYQRTKLEAEQRLRSSGLDWTILRPSVIFGDPGGRMEFATQLFQQIIRPPIPAPLFFPGFNPLDAGRFRLSPVHIDDLAELVMQLVSQPERASGRVLELGGARTLSWREILETLAQVSGRGKWMLPAPALLIQLVAGLLDGFEAFPITRDQLRMLLAGNVAGDGVLREFGIEPRAFEPSQLEYLNGAG